MQLELLGLVVVLLIAWLYLRRRGAARQAQQAAVPRTRKVADTTYHAVSIKFGENACAAAKGMTGHRFLASDAPRLPLPGCDAAVCECRFAHHKDRRAGKDRRSPFGRGSIGGGTGRFDKERREKSDRRKSADPDDVF
jgi:hypothetical protein